MVTGYYPTSLDEALSILEKYPETLLISGGTDIMVVKKQAEVEVFLNRIEELKQVEKDEKVLRIGAGMTYNQLLAKEEIPELIKKAIRGIASPAIRHMGTMAGNICNASPAGDTLPILYALDAKIVVMSHKQGKMQIKKVPIENFIKGIRQIALEKGEMVAAIEIPVAAYESADKCLYQKVGARQSEAISKLSFVGLAQTADGKIKDIRIAFGSVSIKTVRKPEIEQQLIGRSITEVKEKKEEIVASYAEFITPIDDQRSTAVYRKKVCLNLLSAFLEAV